MARTPRHVTQCGPARAGCGQDGAAGGSSLAPDQAAHLALFYDSDASYVAGVMGFLGAGLREADPVAVAVPPVRARLLARHLGTIGADVQVLDMHELGRNPARIIPAVLTMLERHRGRTLHYVGEPVWPGRSREEVQEATRHEALINLAWPGAAIRVLCPYDARRLDAAVLHDAERTHPWVLRSGAAIRSHAYGEAEFPAGTDEPLPAPPARARQMSFGLRELGAVRALVAAEATAAGAPQERVEDLIIAANEVATNAIKHAAADGRISVWATSEAVVCQLEDPGYIADPLAGRYRPSPGADGGIGLWMVNQLCDLVEVRTAPSGTAIRLHTRLTPP